MGEKVYPDLGVAILAGGASRRFGSDKALFRLDPSGPTSIERAVAVGKQISDSVVVIGHPKYEALKLGVPVIEDDAPGKGPLGGIATAIRVLARPRVLVLGCDMPCLSTALLRWIIELKTEAVVVVPQTDDGRFQTMHAIYLASALPAIENALAGDNGAVVPLFSEVTIRAIAASELRVIDPGLDSFVGLNRREDIERALRCAKFN